MFFVKSPSIPQVFAPDTFYLVAEGEDLLSIYVTDAQAIPRHIPLKNEIVNDTIIFSGSMPAVSAPQNLWWETTSGTLFIKYNNGGNPVWVEAVPSVAVPEFAGTGTAETMARSDHYHEGVMVHGDWL